MATRRPPAYIDEIHAKLDEHDARFKELGDYIALTSADVREMHRWLKNAGFDNGTGEKFGLLADLVEQRAEQMKDEEAWARVKGKVANHVPAVLRNKVTWIATSIAVAFMWGFGNRLNIAVGVFLHAHHVPGF